MLKLKALLLMCKGLAMGMAEVVPGVSGGTIAFITGIYERLIQDIKTVSTLPFGVWRKDGIKAFWTHIDGNFLVTLLLGMVFGLVVGIFGISYLLKNYPPVIWGFFFGLIISSAIYIGKKIAPWTLKEVIFLIIGIIVAFLITSFSPVEGTESLLFVFFSGMIAISALILPGISGSFILLLLGMYTYVLHTVKDAITLFEMQSILVVIIFGLGCLTGLALFSRLLSWTFKNFRNPTLAILTGFMIGSLNRIWPWRNPIKWLDEHSGNLLTALPQEFDPENIKVVQETNVLPATYLGDPFTLWVIVSTIIGLAIVFLFSFIKSEEF
jgi:putative membrane protein